MNLTPLNDVLDKHFGKVDTPKRDAFESDVDKALHAYRLGEAIKKARIEQNLTQALDNAHAERTETKKREPLLILFVIPAGFKPTTF